MALQLRPYQLEAIEAIRAGARRGLRRMLLSLPTGTGKTVVFAHLAHRAVARGGRVLVIAHRKELLDQARDKLLMGDPTATIGIVRAEQDECGAPIVVASVQTLARPNRLARVGRFSLVVVDECHHAAAASYRQVLDSLGAFEPDGAHVVGVTATPGRGDGVGLDCVFQEIVFSLPLLTAIKSGYLVDLRAVTVQLATDFSEVPTRGGDLVDGELGDALMAADAPEHVVAAYRGHADGRRAIVFVPTVSLAREMAAAMNRAGVPAAHVSGETPTAERAATLEALRAGSLRAVANAMLLTEGFDCPPVDCIITACPTKSAAFYTQMVGRGTRTYPGKQDCLVLDVVGQAGRHDLVTTASLFGLSPDHLARRTVTEALAAREQIEQEARRIDGRLVSRAVDLFAKRALHWVQSSPDKFILTVPGGRLVVERQDDAWSVVLRRFDGPPTTLGRDLTLGYATGVAEDRARQLGGLTLVNPNARWRQRPASEKQLALLSRRGIRVPDDITAGRASDLIAAGR